MTIITAKTKLTPTPWKIVPVPDEGCHHVYYLLKDGNNRNITQDFFTYNSEWWDYFNHAAYCVNNFPNLVAALQEIVRKAKEMEESESFKPGGINSFDVKILKEIAQLSLDTWGEQNQ